MEGDNGPFILLNKIFNPAGVIGNEGKESILISMFAPKAKTTGEVTGAVTGDDPDCPF